MNSAFAETASVGEALLTGAAMGIYYDVFRIIRRIFPCGYATIVAQDLFFWVTSGIAVFFVGIWCGDGVMRILFVIGALAGWGIYCFTVGAVVVSAVSGGIAMLKRAVNYILRKTS